MTDDEDWDGIGYIINSEYRKQVLKHVTEKPTTPSVIADSTGIPISHISRSISDLREKDFIQLLVEENTKKGRIYGPTEKGQEIWDNIEEYGMLEN